MFEIRFYRGLPPFYRKDDFALLVGGKKFSTPEEAGKARCISGDIVVDCETELPSTSLKWLFDWEKMDPKCYAQKWRSLALKEFGIA